jgi:hypothetical protein
LDEFSQYLGQLPANPPYSYFKEFAYEMVDTVAEYIDRVERTIDPLEVANNIYLSEFSLNWLLLQHGFFKQVTNDHTTNRWKALQNYLECGKELFFIGDPILGSFYNRYGATGRFLLDRRISQTSSHNYFLIFVDELDAPVYWPLAIHELAHCWLSSQDSVVEISSQLETTLEPDIQESCVEEALCDAVASTIMGPSYVFSYINRLWAGFARPKSPEYPKDSFRIELMVRILRKIGYSEEIQEIESMITDLECDDWNDEVIVDSLDLIEGFATQLPFQTPKLETEISSLDDFKKNSPKDIQTLFHVGWTLLNQSNVDTYSEQLRTINQTIQGILERNSATFNTEA